MPRLLTLYLVQPGAILKGSAVESHSTIRLDTNLLTVEQDLIKNGQPLGTSLLMQHDDHGLHHTDIDPYGRPLVYVSTHVMAFTLSELPLLSEWDQSVMKFLSSLDPTIKVIPWWH